jgi:hypothetical protein
MLFNVVLELSNLGSYRLQLIFVSVVLRLDIRRGWYWF